DPQVDLSGARFAKHLHDFLRCRAADDRVVDQDDSFVFDDLAHGVQFHLHSEAPDRLLRLDERPADVVVADEPEGERNPRGARMRSKAHVPEWTTGEPSSSPSTSGRKPFGSRAARISSRPRTTIEKAPRTSFKASTSAPESESFRDRATRCRIISESEVVVK